MGFQSLVDAGLAEAKRVSWASTISIAILDTEGYLGGVQFPALFFIRKQETDNDKLHFLGNYGNTIDGQALPGEVVDEVRKNGENPFIHPLTPPVRPVTNDRQYYHIPWEDSKPCTHIKLTWQDHRRRLYNSNVLLKICERLVGFVLIKRVCCSPSMQIE